MTAPRLEIVAIGDELVHGSVVDTNSAFIARRLEELGCVVTRVSIVGDAEQDGLALLREAGARADLIVITGGLGPTEDDRTRHVAAGAAGVELVFDARCWDWIAAWFAARGRKVGDDNRRQALLPQGALPLANDWGTAPGFALGIGRALAFSLPGVPAEMVEMLEHRVVPRVREQFAARLRPIAKRALVALGLSEAALGQRIADLMADSAAVKVGITPQFGLLTVRVVADGRDDAEASARADAVAAIARARLGADLLYEGEGEPAARLVALAAARGVTLATAESCTGGLIARLLTDVAGASRVFLGGFVPYANERKTGKLGVAPETIATHGAVSEAVAAAMARGALERTGASLALATTGIAGPDGGSAGKPVGTVCFGLARRADPGAPLVRAWTLSITAVSREFVRQRAALEAIAAALRELAGQQG